MADEPTPPSMGDVAEALGQQTSVRYMELRTSLSAVVTLLQANDLRFVRMVLHRQLPALRLTQREHPTPEMAQQIAAEEQADAIYAILQRAQAEIQQVLAKRTASGLVLM